LPQAIEGNSGGSGSCLDYCPYCHSASIIHAGWRYNDRKEDTHKHLCRACKKQFSLDFNRCSHLPAWVWDNTLFYATIGIPYTLIPATINYMAKKFSLSNIGISVVSVYSIVRRTTEILDVFEKNVRLYYLSGKVISPEWEVDERFHHKKKVVKLEKNILLKFLDVNLIEEALKHESRVKKVVRWKYMYPIGVVERRCRYCVNVYAGLKRDKVTAIKALEQARMRTAYEPEEFYCERYPPFIDAIGAVYPRAKVIARSKEEDISIVNTAETIWSIFNLIVPQKRFRSLENLNAMLTLTRHYYNILRPQPSLSGKTPMEAAGFEMPSWAKESWANLLTFACKFNRFVDHSKVYHKDIFGTDEWRRKYAERFLKSQAPAFHPPSSHDALRR